jgi:flagellar motor switch/type III secretory pathway protein FliN
MQLSAEMAPAVAAACQAGSAGAAAALADALYRPFEIVAGEKPLDIVDGRLPEGLDGSGLLLVVRSGDNAAVIALVEPGGLLPEWCAAPFASSITKLPTLAQELGSLLLPAEVQQDSFAAAYATDLRAAMEQGGLAARAAAVELGLTSGELTTKAYLIWPLEQPAELTRPASEELERLSARLASATADGDLGEALGKLPSYMRSLLKIRVPIAVTLAKTKQPVSRIVELAPGSIIGFDKSCEATLALEVNNREVAEGEAVKVGEKFGLRIMSMTLPPERFVPLGRRSSG